MKIISVLFIFVLALFCCTKNVDKKAQVLDSLKKVYADKPIHITPSNNRLGSEPITTQYAYTDKNKSDLAFRLENWYKYKLALEEGFIFVPTVNQPKEEYSDMVLIEITEGNPSSKKGFVPYEYVKEFNMVSYYHH